MTDKTFSTRKLKCREDKWPAQSHASWGDEWDFCHWLLVLHSVQGSVSMNDHVCVETLGELRSLSPDFSYSCIVFLIVRLVVVGIISF